MQIKRRGQQQILDYLQRVADRYQVNPHVRFNTHVLQARYDAPSRLWRVTLLDVGNGASAIQFIAQIAPLAKRSTVFQRSASWIAAKQNPAITRLSF